MRKENALDTRHGPDRRQTFHNRSNRLKRDGASQVHDDLVPRLAIVELLEEQAPLCARRSAINSAEASCGGARGTAGKGQSQDQTVGDQKRRTIVKKVIKQKLAQMAIQIGVTDFSKMTKGKLMTVTARVKTPTVHKLIAR